MLRVERIEDGSKLTLNIEGILDISTVPEWNKHISRLNDITFLNLNFSKLSFIDSTGIGAVLECVYLSREKEFDFVLEGFSEEIKELFETIGVLRVIEAIKKGD